MTATGILLLVVLGLGGLISLAAFVWNLVLCGRQGIGWLLLVLFVPFANLVFLVKFWSEAKRPFFLSIVGIVTMMLPVALDPQGFAKGFGQDFNQRLRQAQARRLDATTGPSPRGPAAAAASPALGEALQREQVTQEETGRRQRRAQEARTAYEKHRAEADILYKSLNARRSKLKVDDAKAVASFNADAARYAALLEQTRVELDATDPNLPAPPTPPVVNATPPPPVAVAAKTPGIYRRDLDAARAARDAASRAESER